MVSAPKTPVKSSAQVGGRGPQRELLVDGQVRVAVAGVGHGRVPSVGWVDGGGEPGDPAGEVRRGRGRTRRRRRRGTGSAIDQCIRVGSVPSSSWAWSQTAITTSPGCRTSARRRGVLRVERQAVSAGGPDRAGVHRSRGVGARRCRRHRAVPGPQGGGELGAGRVLAADEHHPARVAGRARTPRPSSASGTRCR